MLASDKTFVIYLKLQTWFLQKAFVPLGMFSKSDVWSCQMGISRQAICLLDDFVTWYLRAKPLDCPKSNPLLIFCCVKFIWICLHYHFTEVIIRWIASEGWGWWVKQAPSWNSVVAEFGTNADVAFGDVALSKNQASQGSRGLGFRDTYFGRSSLRSHEGMTGLNTYETARLQKKACSQRAEIDRNRFDMLYALNASICKILGVLI